VSLPRDIVRRRVAVVDYGMGNLRSVAKYTSRAGGEVRVSADPADFDWAERIILPGVGAFPDAMSELHRLNLVDPLRAIVEDAKKPLLGICLGMELLAQFSPEVRDTQGLGWVDAEMKPFDRAEMRVPHVGWNQITNRNESPLLDGIDDGSFFYFVHSFHMVAHKPELVAATSNYGHDFTAVIQQGNVYGTQFHPEKSQSSGFMLLRNFIEKDL